MIDALLALAPYVDLFRLALAGVCGFCLGCAATSRDARWRDS